MADPRVAKFAKVLVEHSARIVSGDRVLIEATTAAEPLVRALMAQYPAHRILLTHMTPTGRRTGESLFGANVLRACREAGIPAFEKNFSLTEAYSAEEAFVTGTYAKCRHGGC